MEILLNFFLVSNWTKTYQYVLRRLNTYQYVRKHTKTCTDRRPEPLHKLEYHYLISVLTITKLKYIIGEHLRKELVFVVLFENVNLFTIKSSICT